MIPVISGIITIKLKEIIQDIFFNLMNTYNIRKVKRAAAIAATASRIGPKYDRIKSNEVERLKFKTLLSFRR